MQFSQSLPGQYTQTVEVTEGSDQKLTSHPTRQQCLTELLMFSGTVMAAEIAVTKQTHWGLMVQIGPLCYSVVLHWRRVLTQFLFIPVSPS